MSVGERDDGVSSPTEGDCWANIQDRRGHQREAPEGGVLVFFQAVLERARGSLLGPGVVCEAAGWGRHGGGDDGPIR